MAKPADAGERDLPLLIMLIVGLCGASMGSGMSRQRAAVMRHALAWSEVPRTAAGVGAARVRDRASKTTLTAAGERTVLNLGIRLANRARPYVGFYLLACLALGLYPALAGRFGSAQHWPFGVLAAAAAFTGAAGVGGLAALPATWPLPSLAFGACLAGANVVAAAAFGVLALMAAPGGPKELRHGPTFCPPKCLGAAIPVGTTDSRILPGHSRWIARGGGAIQLPFDRLSCGITVLGEKGSGKSRLLFAIHDAIRERYPDVPVLIHDPKGEWYRTYYDRAEDIYFAPHFAGSAAWALWDDFTEVPELRHELIACTVHAHPDPSGSFWMDQAVDLLKAAISGRSFDLAVEYMRDFAHKHADDKFALSVFGTARLGFLDLAKVELMTKRPGDSQSKPRSIDNVLAWPGRIFLLNDPACEDEQHGAFSLFLSAFLLRALSMPDVPAGTLRAIAIIDEALTFSLPPSVDRRIYALCRSKGICIVAGAQRLPDRRRNEQGEWETAEYTFALKVVNQETQAALSRRAGSLIFNQTQTSTSTHPGSGPSETRSEHDARLDAIPPEHFGRLGPREFVLFHDRGLVTGRTVDVRHKQRSMPLPAFDPRADVQDVSVTLLEG